MSVRGRLGSSRLPLQNRIDRFPAQVEYAGAAPGLVAGVMQVNVLTPAASSSGALPVALKIQGS